MQMTPIAHISTPFKQRFAIPRQANTLSCARGTIRFVEAIDVHQATLGLDGFSNLWLQFVFDRSADRWNPLVRPPRLGGDKKIGVFATRSPFRPNPIGLSLVALVRVEHGEIEVSGVDLLDGTPILDIKPFVHYADSPDTADVRCGFVDQQQWDRLSVSVSEDAMAELATANRRYPGFDQLVKSVLAEDPRPNHLKRKNKSFVTQLYDLDVVFSVIDTHCEITKITPVKP